ncbi:MAG: 4Fe-4S binding protein, partial [Selenomonadaceae bacterium]|nr:4Fe-4S binding protein [Selenomonadaceae bacterium]MBQ1509622.1 4Fe-4S binding protein [Selenomonadaceae bacterium]
DIASAGENTLLSVSRAIHSFLGLEEVPMPAAPDVPLPVRPPVLCAGCPHRASFYAVKQAMKGRKTIYCGDIGCYTLGNAMPLDMCDTCLCMGAGINIAQGVGHLDKETKCFAFVGDSTFFAAGITGVVNAFYNQADMTLVILDNSTTAMTGHQPHPGTGRTVMGQVVEKVSIEKVLRAIGLTTVETVNPLDYEIARDTIKRVAEEPGVKAVIFRSPCIAMTKPAGRSTVDAETCIGCRKCIRELGCPALIIKDERAFIDASLCTGCTLCEQVCPVGAIGGGKKNEE